MSAASMSDPTTSDPTTSDPSIPDVSKVSAPTLFLPGAGGRRSFWQPVAERLSHAGEAQHFPWPGHGDAPADLTLHNLDDLYAWFVARAPERQCQVVAQSMGCVLAMRFALEHPGRVRRLVLVATSGGTRSRFGDDWRSGYQPDVSGRPEWFVRDTTQLDDRLHQIRAPTALIFGDADPIAPVAMGEYLRSLIPGSRLHVIPGGTHVLAEVHADAVAAILDAHFV